MPKRQFGLESLNVLDDGKIGRVFNRELQRAADDVSDRPHVKNARKVTLTALIVPIPDSDMANVQIEIKPASIPSKHSTPIVMELRRDMLVFNEDQFSDLDQPVSRTDEEA